MVTSSSFSSSAMNSKTRPVLLLEDEMEIQFGRVICKIQRKKQDSVISCGFNPNPLFQKHQRNQLAAAVILKSKKEKKETIKKLIPSVNSIKRDLFVPNSTANTIICAELDSFLLIRLCFKNSTNCIF
jgi:hypothetical protein